MINILMMIRKGVINIPFNHLYPSFLGTFFGRPRSLSFPWPSWRSGSGRPECRWSQQNPPGTLGGLKHVENRKYCTHLVGGDWNMNGLWLSIIWMDNPSHRRTPSFFKMVIAPPTSHENVMFTRKVGIWPAALRLKPAAKMGWVHKFNHQNQGWVGSIGWGGALGHPNGLSKGKTTQALETAMKMFSRHRHSSLFPRLTER